MTSTKQMGSFLLVILLSIFSVKALDPSESELQVELPKSCDPDVMFTCSETPLDCIPRELVCNGVSECGNGQDEDVSKCGCLPLTEFQCNATTCIDVIKRCDRRDDCDDGRDELNCETYTCPVTHSKCTNHYCVPNEAVCNYKNDCGDNSDEEKCHYRDCFSTEFRCEDKRCLPIGYLCDNVVNCPDGSDENNCDEHFRCENGLYVEKNRVCDGWTECFESHADETNCGNCTEDEYRCSNGRCIRQSNVCDGVCDCIYTCEDERDCETFECPLGDHYICKNSQRCIGRQYLCDGTNDCWNTYSGADEYFCYNDSAECDVHSATWDKLFYCPEGRCLPASGLDNVVCDHYADCLNGEDEQDCDYKPCNASQFQCHNGQCIPWRQRCNGGTPDCYDRSDELDCDEHSCTYGTRRCKTGQCIPEEYWCDFVRDCPDFSDEDDCVHRKCQPAEFRCANGQCIHRDNVCYNGKDVGRNGCADGSHLLDCRNHSCGPGQFKCHLSYCVQESEICDGVIDCKMTYVDEMNCDFRCPEPEFTCECNDITMNCENRDLVALPYDLSREDVSKYFLGGNRINVSERTFFKESTLTHLDINTNGIEALAAGSFKTLWRLLTLNLENNAITRISNGTFLGLTNLRTLYLDGNNIREIEPHGFLGLSQLHTLNLSYQALEKLPHNTFIGLKHVMTLHLSHNHISEISEGAFNGLYSLLTLDLSHNEITTIHDNLMHGLQRMTFLDISHNVIGLINEDVFSGLINLNELITDEFRFCCAANIAGRCLPEPDEFSSCTDLMSNYVLRISIWVLGWVGFIGNIIVIVWRTRDLRNGKVHSFLITNLAIGDFLMGVYLMIIAVVDSYYRGSYILYDQFWRESTLCKFAGFLSTFSSELSVFTLTVITMDRLICIIFPLKLKRLKLKTAFIVMVIMWLIVFGIAAVPLLGWSYFDNFYGRSGVCLAFHITNEKPKGWEYSVVVFLVLNFISFVVIFLSYLWMFFVARKTTSAVRKPEQKSDNAMARRMTLIVLTDFMCWVPIILLGFASLCGANVPPQVYAWVAVFVLPLNSAVNPVIYTISTAPFLRNCRKKATIVRKSFTSSMKNDTKHSFLEDRSSHAWDRKPIYRNMELVTMRSLNNKSSQYTPVNTRSTQADM